MMILCVHHIYVHIKQPASHNGRHFFISLAVCVYYKFPPQRCMYSVSYLAIKDVFMLKAFSFPPYIWSKQDKGCDILHNK